MSNEPGQALREHPGACSTDPATRIGITVMIAKQWPHDVISLLADKLGITVMKWPHDVISLLADKLPSGANFETFVETGTLLGATATHEAAYFRQVHTIELSKELFEANIPRFAPFDNIHAHLGNSADCLQEVIAQVEGDCLFYLDAHWSGDSTVDWTDSEWKGYGVNTSHLGEGTTPTPEEQCPLLEELKIINDHCNGSCMILIDDIHVVGKTNVCFRGEDWSHISFEKIDACFDEGRILDKREVHLVGQNAQYIVLLNRR